MENTSECKMEIEKIKQERDSWKETALIAGSPVVMKSIETSDRKSVVQGKSVDLGGRRIIKKKKKEQIHK